MHLLSAANVNVMCCVVKETKGWRRKEEKRRKGGISKASSSFPSVSEEGAE